MFGTEYHAECYCGNELSAAAVLKPDTDCSTVCGGNGQQACGGPDRLSVYKIGQGSRKREEHVRRHGERMGYGGKVQRREGNRRKLFDEVVEDGE